MNLPDDKKFVVPPLGGAADDKKFVVPPLGGAAELRTFRAHRLKAELRTKAGAHRLKAELRTKAGFLPLRLFQKMRIFCFYLHFEFQIKFSFI